MVLKFCGRKSLPNIDGRIEESASLIGWILARAIFQQENGV